jgi:PAS domain S-box-containing protein
MGAGADRALRDSESRFRSLFDQAAVGMCFVALDGAFLRTNRRMSDIVGYSLEELTGMTCVELTHPDDRLREKETTARMIEGQLPAATWEKRYVRKDGSPVWCNLTLTLLCDESGAASQFAGVVEDISERRSSAQKLEQNESLLRIAAHMAQLGAWSYDCVADDLWWSDEVYALHDVPVGAAPSLAEAYAYYTAGSRERAVAVVERCLEAGEAFDLEQEISTAGGLRRWVRATGHAGHTPGRLVGAIQDITARKQAELEMVRVNRALKMTSGCNEVLIRATDEQQLLADICALVVDTGGYSMAWVGFALPDERRTVQPVASSGACGFLSIAPITWADRDPGGRGGAGQTIRSGRAMAVADLAVDPNILPWRVAALENNCRSAVYLPLRTGARTFGVLCLYKSVIYSPPQTELDLLQELADDLAFGIGHLRSQVEQQRIQAAVLKISAAVSVRTSTEFFERLAANMADAVGAQAACIARYHPTQPNEARTIVAVVDGTTLPNFELCIEGTPCADLRADAAYVVPARLRASGIPLAGSPPQPARKLSSAGVSTIPQANRSR